MMYVVTKEGKKRPVDNSSIGEDEWISFQQTVGLYTDNTILKDVWILEMFHRDYFAPRKNVELEPVQDVYFDHEPTKEEILWAMSAYGCTRGDIVFVTKGYELDMEGD